MSGSLRFRLDTLLLVMVVVATSVALAGGWGFLLAAYAILLVRAIRGSFARHALWRSYLLAVVLLGLTLQCVLVPVLSEPRDAGRSSLCRENLKVLALALDNYRGDHGRFPPPYVADKDGKPMHSWRVLILPYLEERLWEQYRFDEPWDGPNNRQLAPMRCSPVPFLCLSDRSNRITSTTTNYLMVTGPGTASEALSAKGSAKLVVPKRILLVEVANSGIDWMEPKDLTLEEARAGLFPESGLGMSSQHTDPKVVHVALADGRVIRLSRNLPPETLEALLTGDLDEAAIDEIARMWVGPPRHTELRVVVWMASLVILLAHGVLVDRRDRKRKTNQADPSRSPSGTEGE
jgi:hypothetical protein